MPNLLKQQDFLQFIDSKLQDFTQQSGQTPLMLEQVLTEKLQSLKIAPIIINCPEVATQNNEQLLNA